MNRVRKATGVALSILVATTFVSIAHAQISPSPTSLSFANTYIGKAAGSQVITVNDPSGVQVVISSVAFTCPGYGLASGVAPFTLYSGQLLTHYSIFFRPTAAQSYNCDFIINIKDAPSVLVPLTGTGLASSGVASISVTSMSFPNQSIGSTSAAQNVTITNTGTGKLTLNTITPEPPSFSVNAVVTLPYTINASASLTLPVVYTPSQITSETGALDLTYNEIPDNGVSLSGNGIAASTLAISTNPTLPQATQSAAYQTTLATSGGIGPYTWSLASGSTLPSGLTLSSAGVLSGTLASSVAVAIYPFTVQVTDSASGKTTSSALTLGVYANQGDNCNDLSFDVPNTTTPMIALTDLGTGTYQGSEGGLYPNGSNTRPSAQDSYGVTLAQGIQPLDANGNPSSTGKFVLLAVGESTAQNEFNTFLPIANSDPTKNPYLLLVNGSQGGATPQNFTSTNSTYWGMVLNNYLPQNGVTANQVAVIWMEDTDGIATGTFPSDISALQSQYETIMQTMLTLFPNLKMVYFSSRVYAGYSNGVGKPDNPEPYAYEVGFAVKWAIQDQLNGNTNLNYNPALGPVVAPWMSWGPYYWANGMLGRNDGLEWDCEDFAADGTHPNTFFGQAKVASELLSFLKTDDTTIPWYLAPKLNLSATAGNNQSGNPGTILPTALTILASNLNGNGPESGVSVTFSDNGAGGTFGTPTAVTSSTGTASTTYTLPATAKAASITASSAGYTSATFTETSGIQALSATAGNNQTGVTGTTLPTALTVLAANGGIAVAGVTVTFSDGGAGGSFGTPTAVTGGNGMVSTTYMLPSAAETIAITASSAGYTSASFTETSTPSTTVVTTLSLVSGGKQSGTVGTTLPQPIVVRAKNSSGAVVAGASITFSDGSLGTFSPNPAITASNGQASTSYTLPTVAQSLTVTAADGSVSVNVSEKSVAGPASTLSIFSGNNQSGTHGKVLPKKLIVLVTDQYANPFSGITVTFTDNGAGGAFNPVSPATGANGQASTTYTAGATAGTATITATATGLAPVSFTETIH